VFGNEPFANICDGFVATVPSLSLAGSEGKDDVRFLVHDECFHCA
jgi:hypothetical protein